MNPGRGPPVRWWELHALPATAALLLALITYGVMQERIMTHPYGGEMFPSSLLLVFVNRALTVLVSGVALLASASNTPPSQSPPAYNYIGVSCANVLATTAQFEALKYVSFPVQTLVKTSKMMPVMIWGTIIMGKKYEVRDYLVAAAVMAGCSVFLLTGDVTVHSRRGVFSDKTNELHAVMGALLMLAHLGCDGFASTFQDKMFHQFGMSFYVMTFHVSAVSCVLSFGGLVLQQQLLSSFTFVSSHPEVLRDMLLLAVAATSTQLLITYCIRTYGALLFATVQTTRQFLSILLSCLLFAHTLTLGQISGTAVVFCALFYRVFTRKAPESEKKLELPQLLVEGTLTLSNGDELEGLLHHRDVPDAESPRVV